MARILERCSTGRGIPAACLLIALTVLAYVPAFDAGFVLDDDAYVTEDARMSTAGGLWRIWTEVVGDEYQHQYYPLTSSVFWLQHRLWGIRPFGYHLVNVLLHALNAVLLWRLLRLLAAPGAWVAAAIFAVHPVHVQSVAWVSELKNVLSACFFLLSAIVFVRWHGIGRQGIQASRHQGIEGKKTDDSDATMPSSSPWLYVVGLALFICALLSKSATCLLPAALALVVWWKRGRLSRRDLAAILPLAALGLSFVLVTVYLESHFGGARGEAFSQTWVERVLIAGRSVWFYAGKLAWPAGLTIIYPRWEIDAVAWRQYLYPVGVVVALAVAWSLRGRLGRGPVAAAAYFILALAPLSFVNVAFTRLSYVADHWLYWASMGPIALLVASAFRSAEASGGRAAGHLRLVRIGAAVLALGVLSTLTWQRCMVFQNSRSLWTDAVDRNGRSWAARNNLGLALSSDGLADEAAAQYRHALAIKPDYARAHYNLANILVNQGRSGEAIEHYHRSLEIDPDFSRAHYNLANSLRLEQRFDEAASHYRHAVRLEPDLAVAHGNLGGLLMLMGRPLEAAEHFRRALQIDPDLDPVRDSLELAERSSGQWSVVSGQEE